MVSNGVPPLRSLAWLGRLALLFLAHAMGTASITLVLTTGPAVQSDLGLSHAEFGLIVAAYFACVMAFTFPAGWLVDRFSPRPALICAHVLLASGMSLLAGAGGPRLAAASLALCGIGYALINPATARGVLLWMPLRRRATAMGIKQTGVPAGGVTAALAVAVTGAGWRELAVGFAAATLVASIGFIWLRAPPTSSRTVFRWADLRRLLARPSLAAFNVGACCYSTVQGALFAYLVLYLHQALKLEPSVASLCLGAAHVGSALGRLGWGFLSDLALFGGRLQGLVACGGAGVLSFALLLLIPEGSAPGAPLLVAVLLGFSVGGYAGLAQTAAVEMVETRWAGISIAYSVLLSTTGSMLGPVVFGSGVDLFGYGPSWTGAAGLLATGAAWFLIARAIARARP